MVMNQRQGFSFTYIRQGATNDWREEVVPVDIGDLEYEGVLTASYSYWAGESLADENHFTVTVIVAVTDMSTMMDGAIRLARREFKQRHAEANIRSVIEDDPRYAL
jgi:hypothetical protein